MINLPKTKILASVKSFKETKIVSVNEVDIIDFKDPEKGALGDLSENIIKESLEILPKKQKTSATIGDIHDTNKVIKKVIKFSKLDIDFIKIGIFFNEKKLLKLSSLKKEINPKKKLIAVFFADKNPNIKIINNVKEINFD